MSVGKGLGLLLLPKLCLSMLMLSYYYMAMAAEPEQAQVVKVVHRPEIAAAANRLAAAAAVSPRMSDR